MKLQMKLHALHPNAPGRLEKGRQATSMKYFSSFLSVVMFCLFVCLFVFTSLGKCIDLNAILFSLSFIFQVNNIFHVICSQKLNTPYIFQDTLYSIYLFIYF